MGNIVIAAIATLDGVTQDPDGVEGFKRGGWWKQFIGNDFEAWLKLYTDEALRAKALLLGRRSNEWFGSRSPSRNGEYYDRLNSMPKYVVSSTLKDSTWKNATIVKGDLATEISKLKQKVDGDILVYGSYQLGQALMEHDLVDELRLVIFPVVLGAGERVFGATSAMKPFRVLETRTLGEGLVLLTYKRVGGA